MLLRALEYYRGILFLTTNRVGVIDEAVLSRIHVTFGFPDLTDMNREKIWLNNFERLERTTNIGISHTARAYIQSSEVVDLKWNGRHIRNGKSSYKYWIKWAVPDRNDFTAFQTAVTLAEADSIASGDPPKISQEHLGSVVQLSTAFKTYMCNVHMGQSNEQLATRKGIRADVQKEPADCAKLVGC